MPKRSKRPPYTSWILLPDIGKLFVTIKYCDVCKEVYEMNKKMFTKTTAMLLAAAVVASGIPANETEAAKKPKLSKTKISVRVGGSKNFSSGWRQQKSYD